MTPYVVPLKLIFRDMGFAAVQCKLWLCIVDARSQIYSQVKAAPRADFDVLFRTTLIKMASDKCWKLEEFKAWGMNMDHDNMAVTFGAYLLFTQQRKKELINRLGNV